jgi:UDP-GlcNAc:undecaprenyl-phosphate/decaprenyl-phosphate GlcNAc-1-phosphate transferase
VLLDLLVGAAIAALASLIACRVIIAAGPVDRPSLERHEHKEPTPTSGGLGIAIGVAAALVLLAFASASVRAEIHPRGAALLALSTAFSYVFLVIGFWDDAQPISARLKFVLFTVASLGAALAVEPILRFPLWNGDVYNIPYWLGLVGTALWIFTLVNGVNFMDGVNGLAMGTIAIGLAALAGISFVHGSISGVALSLYAVGALIGFLVWNFPSGRLFAGDSGALFAGAVAALASLTVIHRTGISPLIPAIVFFPIFGDVLVTLAWRAWRRRSLLDGHSEHIYQILRHGGMSHAEITLMYWTATAACGGLAFLVAEVGGWAPWVTLAVLAVGAVIVSTAVRRFAGRRGIGGV